jgi:hypothetical protein
MKTLSVVATLVTCFLLCGFHGETSSSQRNPAPQVAPANKQKADGGKTRRVAAPPTQPATDAADKNATSATGSREADKVEVTALPPEIAIKQIKDSIDRTIMWCTITLTFVGIAGTFVAVWTLFVIKKQAKIMDEHRVSLEQLARAAQDNAAAANKNAEATEKDAGAAKANADAALLNAKALINAERPWVMVQVEEIPGENAAKTQFQLHAFNYGNSPAHVISCKGPTATWCDDPNNELTVPPDYGTWEWDERFLAPRERLPMREAIEPWSARVNFVTPRAIQGVPTPGKSQLVVYGLLEYRDGVTETIHRTAFCYRRKRDKLSDMGGHLVSCGPRVYNEYT